MELNTEWNMQRRKKMTDENSFLDGYKKGFQDAMNYVIVFACEHQSLIDSMYKMFEEVVKND